MTADALIDKLQLTPHPEGGYYKQTWIDRSGDGRASGTSIFYLLKQGQKSHWHHVDATEIWHFYAGAPLALCLSATDEGPAKRHILGPDVLDGQSPQIIVPKYHWQSAQSLGDYTLVGCTVSPAFHFDGFTLADAGFDIPFD